MIELVDQSSKCLSRRVGVVLLKNDCIVSTGYNGPPRGTPHCDVRHQEDEFLWKRLSMGNIVFNRENAKFIPLDIQDCVFPPRNVVLKNALDKYLGLNLKTV